MSAAVMILGESGTGKSTSMRNLDPHETLLIQTIKKPLPFRSKNWSYLSNENASGNMIVCDNSEKIISLMRKTKRPVIVLDDFQYLLANEFMRRTEERGYDKFTDIGKHAWEVLTAASTLPDHVRVYIMAHTIAAHFGDAMEDRRALRGYVTDEVKRTNGQIRFEDAQDIQQMLPDFD